MGYTLEQLQSMGASPVTPKRGLTYQELIKQGAKPYTAPIPTPIKEPTFKENATSWLKEFPKSLKTVATQPFKHPVDTAMSLTAGLGDIGVSMANSVLKLSDFVPSPAKNAPRNKGIQLDYLSKALADSKPEGQQDISTALSSSSKMMGEYALGGKIVGNLGVKNNIAKGVLGDITGGQLALDPNTSMTDRTKQAAFDSVFGLVTAGSFPLAKKVFSKKKPIIETPKAPLTPEEYAIQQGYEPIIPDTELPTIKMGKTPKGEPTVKYGSNPRVFDEQGFRQVEPNEVLPNGYTTKINQTTGETITNAPVKELPQEFSEIVKPMVKKFGLSDYTPNEYSKFKVALSYDKNTGYAIKPDGDLISVFNKGGKGNGAFAVVDAIENGAKKLDNFDGKLTEYYKRFGFDEVKREANWTPGQPDVVYMKLNPTKYAKFKKNNPQYYSGEFKFNKNYEASKPKPTKQPKTFEEAVISATPKFKKEVVELSKKLDDIPGFTPSQKVKEAAAFQNHIDNSNTEHIIKVAQGIVKDENMSKETAFKLAEEYFDNTNQYDKLLELSKSNVSAQAGQNLSMLNQGEGASGAAEALKKARIIKEQALLRKGIDVEKEIGKYYDSAYTQLKQGKDVNQVIGDLIDFLTCK
jgi:hypothetical protein